MTDEKSTAGEREAFEAWVRSAPNAENHFFERWPNGDYKSQIMHIGYMVWRGACAHCSAAWNTRTPPPSLESLKEQGVEVEYE